MKKKYLLDIRNKIIDADVVGDIYISAYFIFNDFLFFIQITKFNKKRKMSI